MSLDLDRLRAAQRDFASRPPQAVIEIVLGFCERLCDAADPWRAALIARLAASSGLSTPVIEFGLQTTAGAWIGQEGDRASAIRALLTNELTYPEALAGWVPAARPGEEVRWVPVPVSVQILAGNVFAATIHQLLAGLVARTGQILKPATGDADWVTHLVAGLSLADPDLAATVAIAHVADHDPVALDALLRAADVVTITGSDATVEQLTGHVEALNTIDGRDRVAHGFPHRLSAAYIARFHWEDPDRLAAAAAQLAIDVCAYDQSGCLSPHVAFIEDCLPSDLPDIAATLFNALQQRTATWPVGQQDAGWHTARRLWLDRSRMGAVDVLADDAVAVALDAHSPVRLAPGGRTLIVAPVGFPQGVLERLRPWQHQLGSLGVALHPAVTLKGFRQSSGLFGKGPSGEVTGPGFNRICPIGEMQTPRIDEPHDGRPRVRLFLRRETRAVS